jgi:hypothetical protein
MSDPPRGAQQQESDLPGPSQRGLDGHGGAEGGASKVTAVDADFGQRLEHVIDRGEHAARRRC